MAQQQDLPTILGVYVNAKKDKFVIVHRLTVQHDKHGLSGTVEFSSDLNGNSDLSSAMSLEEFTGSYLPAQTLPVVLPQQEEKVAYRG